MLSKVRLLYAHFLRHVWAERCIHGTGVLYEYTFNREAVLNVFDLPSSDWHVYALHLAIVHMHDVELVDKVCRHTYSLHRAGTS